MKAVAIHAPGDIRIDEIPTPEPGPGEVLVKVRACGICGSDLPRAFGTGAHFYPVILGHEAAGEVVAVGSDVDDYEVGDRVAITPLVPCMQCDSCLQGNYSLCKSYSFIGSRQQGCMAEYVAVPSRCLLKLPAKLSYERAAMVEPATVPLHGLFRCRTVAGLRVVVLGTGTIGLLAVQWAKFLGASQVIAVDVNEYKLEKARQLGADLTINPNNLKAYGAETLQDAIESVTAGHKADIVVETAGLAITQVQSVDVAANNGTVLYVGTAEKDVTFPAGTFEAIIRKELTVLGSWMSYSPPFPGREWILSLQALSEGQVKVQEMITHRFPLSEARKALEMLRSGKDTVKVMLINDWLPQI